MKYDTEYTYSKLELAKAQLEKAIELFLEESNYACSITLAGASEEILGKLLIEEGKEPELKEYATQCAEDSKNIVDTELQEKDFATEANYFRNHCKHYMDGNPITISGWAASGILNRAITNYFSLTGEETELMKQFNWKVNGV